MKITVMQPGIEYYYECNEQCDHCPLRFICYTTKWNKYKDDSTLRSTYRGFPQLDLLLGKAKIIDIIKQIGSNSSTWSGLSG